MISSKPPNILFPNLVLWCIVSKLGTSMHHHESECHAKRLICYSQGQGHCKSSYDQNMAISTVSFELLNFLLPKLGLIVHYRKSECFMEKFDCCVQGQGHSKISKCHCFSRSLLNRWTFYYLTWYGGASLWARLSFKKISLLSSGSRSQLRII